MTPETRGRHRSSAAEPVDLELVAAAWERALDADERALTAAGSLEGRLHLDVGEQRRSLAHERQEIAVLLTRAARIA